jgi:hypothetical protein
MLSMDELIVLLQKNQDKNFVQRIMKPDTSPVLMDWNGPGTWGTHAMASGNVDGQAIAYPTIVDLLDGKLTKLNTQDAVRHAIKTNEFIPFDSDEEALWFGKNYKKVWGQ